MSFTLSYHTNAERPTAKLWLLDDDGTLINFATGYTFVFKIGHPLTAALLTKATGITGAAGSGTEPTGVPNIELDWAAGELNITPGVYACQLIATTSAEDRTFEGKFIAKPTIT